MSSLTITRMRPNLHWENKIANLEMLAQKLEYKLQKKLIKFDKEII